MKNYHEGFVLGEWQVYPDTGMVSRNGLQIHAEPKVMDLLMALIRSPEQFGSREQLLARVWPDVVVNEEVLTRAVSELRTLLGDTSRHRRYIMTVPKRGYKLLLTPGALPAEPTMKKSRSRQAIRRWGGLLFIAKLSHHIAVTAGYIFLGAGTWLYWGNSIDHPDAPAQDGSAIAQSSYNCNPNRAIATDSKFKPA